MTESRPTLVLFAPADEAFVRGFLLRELGGSGSGGGPAELRVLDLARTSVGDLDRELAACRATLVVVSAAFLADPWARHAELLASDRAVFASGRVVALQLEAGLLPPHLAMGVHVDLSAREGWEAALESVRALLAVRPAAPAQLACPYPGMRPFAAGDRAAFHGRDDEIAELLRRIAAGERALHVIGPSGCGKSSLVAAGVVPRLPGVARTLRPGDDPYARLAEALGVAGVAAPVIDHAAIADCMRDGGGDRLILVVDQLEELFAQAPAVEHLRFARALQLIAEHPQCVVLFTLRADFYAELLASPLWAAGLRTHVALAPLRGDALRAAIEAPARALEVYFEPGLVERLLADAADAPGVLPLLQETLVALWARRRHRLLALADYEALGGHGRSGLAAAISARADRCLADLAPSDAALARRLLLRLVSFGEGRPDTRRRQSRRDLDAPPGSAADRVLRALTEARLITLDGDHGATDQVDLSHDALVTAWPPFAELLATRRADELRRRQIQATADTWVERGRKLGGLLDADELAGILAWRRTDAALELGESTRISDLVHASQRRLAWARWLRRAAVTAAVLAALAVGLAIWRSREAAIAAQARTAADLGAARLATREYQRAIPHFAEARALGLDTLALRTGFGLATRSVVERAFPHPGATWAAQRDRRVFSTGADGAVRIWDADTGALRQLLRQPVAIAGADLDAAGRRLVTVDRLGAMRVWDVDAPARAPRAIAHRGQLTQLAISADGARVTTAGSAGVQVWDAATGARELDLAGAGVTVQAVRSRDGRWIATSHTAGSAQLWSGRTGAWITALPHFGATIEYVGLSADGTRAVTAGNSQVSVWDTATGARLRVIAVDRATFAALSPDHQRLIADSDTRAVLFDVESGKRLAELPHATARIEASFSGDSTRVLTTSADRAVGVWSARDGGEEVRPLQLAAAVESASWADARGANAVITASRDGVVRRWRLDPVFAQLSSGRTRAATFAANGARFAAGSDGGLDVFARDGTRLRHWRELGTGMALAVSPDGARLLAVGVGDATAVFDIEDGHRVELVGSGRAPLRVTPPGAYQASASFSPDARWVVGIAGDTAAQVWDAQTGAPRGPRLAHPARVNTAAFSRDGRRIATACDDGNAYVWDATTGAPLATVPHGAAVRGAQFGPDDRYLVTSDDDSGRIQVWRGRDYRHHASLAHLGAVIGVAFAPDAARLITSSHDQTVRIWDLERGVAIGAPLDHRALVESMSVSADGTVIATAAGRDVQLWDAATGRPIGPPMLQPGYVRGIALDPRGELLVAATMAGARIWHIAPAAGDSAAWTDIASRVPALAQERAGR